MSTFCHLIWSGRNLVDKFTGTFLGIVMLNGNVQQSHSCICMCVHMRSMTQKLLCRAHIYVLDMCTIICMSMNACQLHTHQTWFACMLTYIWIVNQGLQYKLYEHVPVLISIVTYDANTTKSFLLQSWSPYTIFGIVLLPIIIGNSQINSNVTN